MKQASVARQELQVDESELELLVGGVDGPDPGFDSRVICGPLDPEVLQEFDDTELDLELSEPLADADARSVAEWSDSHRVDSVLVLDPPLRHELF